MSHLIINDRPPTFSEHIIYPNNTSQTIIFNDLINYCEYHNYHQNALYAITLTIPTETAKLIRSKNKSVIGYFNYILNNLKYKGIFTTEYTKQGTEHLHGVLKLNKTQREDLKSKRIKIKGKYQNVLYTEQYPYENIIKPINTLQQHHWRKYMLKHQLHQTVLDFFNQS